MNKILSIILVTLALYLTSCDPDNKDIFNPERVKISGTFNNVSESIALGDTIKLNIELPDTVVSNGRGYFVQSLQKSEFSMDISKLDTINKRSILISPPAYFTTNGSISPTSSLHFSLSKAAKPFRLTINFKPTEKGIYYFGVTSQAGQLKINNSFEARLVVGFDVPDKHIYLAEPFAGLDWANEARTREPGIYVFRVN